MAKKKQIGRRVEGWKAKSWYKVYTPETYGKVYIGDIVSADPDNLIGRVMAVSLGEIIQDYSKQYIKMRFRINNVAGDAAYTEFIGHEVTRDYLRSHVKRRTSRIDATVTKKVQGGRELQVTITCFTLNRAKLSHVHAIRAKMLDVVDRLAKEMDYETFAKAAVNGDISREIFKESRTIFPIRRIDVIKSEAVSTAAQKAAAIAA
ncbi:MAG: 30S ribosomal protein S3ae [Methanocalculus sp. MSAO_Arc1]|uniref:30S ribosomal protein S3ae n=1 Tax=Methanocalculus TaxID=71151 RepID=UPI000FF79CF7|nr:MULTISPECIES: 30S ribosomal protein S3ae [unclassified Methanocalculus]MCP1662224.1 small subunit ribosomal protein S3Ae [Methanocalculus sp. AMF5]RQD81680.1 MAG: 30S ribosomal protein S3ae [Methanocalculus sp. MSAO_Arc1]